MAGFIQPDDDGARRTSKSNGPTGADQLKSSSLANSTHRLILNRLLSPRFSRPQSITIRKAHPNQTEAVLAGLCPTLRPETLKELLSTLNNLTSLDPAQIRLEQSDGPIKSITESKRFFVGEKSFKYCKGKIELIINDEHSIWLTIATASESAPISPSNSKPYSYTIEATFLSSQANISWQQLASLLQTLYLHDPKTVIADSELEASSHPRIVSAHFNHSLTIDLYVKESLSNKLAVCLKAKSEQLPPVRPDHPLDGRWLPHSIQLQGPTRLERIQIEHLLKSREIGEIEASGLMEEAYNLVASRNGLGFDTVWKFNDKLSDTIAIEFFLCSALDEEQCDNSNYNDNDDYDDYEDYEDYEDCDDVDEDSYQEECPLDESHIKFHELPTTLGTVSVEILPSLQWSKGKIIDLASLEFDEDSYNLMPVIRIDFSQLQRVPSKTRLKKAWALIGKIGEIVNQPNLQKELREALDRKSRPNDCINYRDDRVLIHCGKYGAED